LNPCYRRERAAS